VRIYFDVSSLNRPFDDQGQERIRIEAEAVALILARCGAGGWRQVSSAMALIEISANPDAERRRNVRSLLPVEDDIIDLDESIVRRAQLVEAMGFTRADAAHIAASEAQRADVLLTCDDRFLRAAQRSKRRLAVKVANPVIWLEEQDVQNT
jgi:predicted nucleic acid-binding protein